MKTLQVFVAVICFVALAIPMIGGTHKAGEKRRSAYLSAVAVAALRLEGKARKEQLSAMSQEHADLEAALVRELDNTTDVEGKCAVIYLMGRYRLERCSREVAKYVTLKYEATEDNDKKPLWGTYPAVEALTKIGKPAVWHMFRNIEAGKEDEFRRLSTEVIRKIEGTEVGMFVLELEIKKAKDETARKRLEGALEYLQKVKG